MAGKKMSGVYVSWPKPSFTTVVRTNKHFRTNFHMAMMYAHYELSASELKKEVIKYLRSKDVKHPLLERIKDIDENRFMTIGKYMYIQNQGGDLPEDIAPNVIPKLEEILDEEEARIIQEAKRQEIIAAKAGSNKVTSVITRSFPSIQDRLKEKAHEVAGEVEGWIDEFFMDRKQPSKTVEEFINLFKATELKTPHMRFMTQIFQRRAAEISEAVEGKDKQLSEGWSRFTKPELKKFEQFHSNLLKACEMMQEVAKVERAPRVKKPVSTDKLVAKLKYKKEDPALGIVSQNPVQIIGSKELWVYNTKTRKLSQYKALDERGLTVKGASVMNYSSDSVEKTVRKPAETLADFKKASKVKLRTFLKELSTVDVPAPGKINEHHVLLRIDK